MALTRITDHEARALSRLLLQWADAQKLRDLIATAAKEVQALEDAVIDYAEQSTVSTAGGALLDVIGDIVGEPRRGRTDDEYRAAIMLRVWLNRGSGEPERVIAAAASLAPGGRVILEEHYPAQIGVTIEGAIVDPAVLVRAIKRAKPAGVSLIYVIDAGGGGGGAGGPGDPTDMFAFAGATDGKGFGTVDDPAAGGQFAALVSG